MTVFGYKLKDWVLCLRRSVQLEIEVKDTDVKKSSGI